MNVKQIVYKLCLDLKKKKLDCVNGIGQLAWAGSSFLQQ